MLTPLIVQEQIQVLELEEGELVRVSGNDQGWCYMVLNGRVGLRDHSQDNPADTQLIKVAKKGSILGAPEFDKGHSSLPLVWASVVTHQAHVARMKKETLFMFLELLKQSGNREKEILLEAMHTNKLFRNLSFQTQIRVIYSLGVTHTFQKGTLVQEWAQRSPWQHPGQHQTKNYKPLISLAKEDSGYTTPIDGVRPQKFDSVYQQFMHVIVGGKDNRIQFEKNCNDIKQKLLEKE